jgi:tellurite resistance protein TehA-like permease
MSDHYPQTVSPLVINLFMAIGLLSAVAFRLLTIVNTINPALMRPVWYFGVIGYIFFFAYRYHITSKRKKAIRVHHLLEKIRSGSEITSEDRMLIEYVLSSVSKSKENINYLFIFLLSIMAVVVDILLAAGGQ